MVEIPVSDFVRIYLYREEILQLLKVKSHSLLQNPYNFSVSLSGSRHTDCRSLRQSTAYFPVSLVEICNKLLSLKVK